MNFAIYCEKFSLKDSSERKFLAEVVEIHSLTLFHRLNLSNSSPGSIDVIVLFKAFIGL